MLRRLKSMLTWQCLWIDITLMVHICYQFNLFGVHYIQPHLISIIEQLVSTFLPSIPLSPSSLALVNKGNCVFSQGYYDKARDYYQEALSVGEYPSCNARPLGREYYQEALSVGEYPSCNARPLGREYYQEALSVGEYPSCNARPLGRDYYQEALSVGEYPSCSARPLGR